MAKKTEPVEILNNKEVRYPANINNDKKEVIELVREHINDPGIVQIKIDETGTLISTKNQG